MASGPPAQTATSAQLPGSGTGVIKTGQGSTSPGRAAGFSGTTTESAFVSRSAPSGLYPWASTRRRPARLLNLATPAEFVTRDSAA